MTTNLIRCKNPKINNPCEHSCQCASTISNYTFYYCMSWKEIRKDKICACEPKFNEVV
jgi:hypothetical protein